MPDDGDGRAGDVEAAVLDWLRPLVDAGGDVWVAQLAAASERAPLPLPVLRSVTSELSWASRRAGHPYLTEQRRAELRGRPGSQSNLVVAYVRCQRLRFDFRFEELERAASDELERCGDDALLLALLGFARLGAGDRDGLLAVDAALAHQDADRRTRHVCLHALATTTAVADAPRRALDLCDAMLARGESDAIVFHRRAGALRLLGDLDGAQRAILRALALHPPGDTQVHQDIVREQEAIRLTGQLEERATSLGDEVRRSIEQDVEARIAQIGDVFERKLDDANRVLVDGLLRIVEILGLFVTLIGFLAASGFVLSRTESFWQLLASVAAIGAGAVAFFAGLRLVVYRRPGPRRPS